MLKDERHTSVLTRKPYEVGKICTKYLGIWVMVVIIANWFLKD